jgi:hypothetical protein
MYSNVLLASGRSTPGQAKPVGPGGVRVPALPDTYAFIVYFLEILKTLMP